MRVRVGVRVRVRVRVRISCRQLVLAACRTGAAGGPRDDERDRGALDEFEGRSPAGGGVGRGLGVEERESTLQRTGW